MTQEEKQLLIKELCARLPYGVLLQYTQKTFAPQGEIKVDIKLEADGMLGHRLKLLDFKPYLRQMSSMTEEEKKECNKLRLSGGMAVNVADYIDWLNSHHFDYRGLIEKGLAIEAPENMYN